MTYYIVAGTYNEFCNFCKRNEHTGLFYEYVVDYRMLMGLSDIKGFYVGTWRNRPDIDLIQSKIATIKAKGL